jgi:4-amino-4-deoxy-L-arabinose transferase-like glycosyltransferase
MTATIGAPAAAPSAPSAQRRCRVEGFAFAGLLVAAAALYLWDLSASGWANSYYAAAVQTMSQDWTAFLFGSLDAGNLVTVDKPPASLWVMALSARIFGFSSWSMLVPQALLGVASVALLYATVRRVSGPRAAFLAGVVLAVTPVAALMFRYNNPDALLVFLLVGAAYATVRGIERAGTRWLVLAGVLIGFGFLTKMAQALLVLPALALAYLVAAPTGVGRRIRQLLAAGAAMVVSAGWWYALVELWPADSRPYIGGSTSNSALELALGYNGLGRLFGTDGNGMAAGGGSGGDAMPGGSASPMQGGWLRMFGESVGGQISWLLPAALALLMTGLWLTRRAPRTDRIRASLIVWGGWTLVTGIVFSLMSGIFHEYYTVALAPGVAALVGIGGAELWRRRGSWPARIALAVVVAGTAVWAWVLLGRTPDFLPWLRWVIVSAGVVAVVILLFGAIGRRAGVVVALLIVLTGLAGPTAYAVQTALTSREGTVPTAGPATTSGGLHAAPDGNARTDAELVALMQSAGTKWSAAAVSALTAAPLQLDSGTSVISIGGFGTKDPAPTLEAFQEMVTEGQVRYYIEGSGSVGAPDAAQLQQMAEQNPQLAEMLEQVQANGSSGVGMPGQDPDSESSKINEWVQANFTPMTVGGVTVYDLASPKT